MTGFDLEYIYSLYNPDDGVVLYDSAEEAKRIKQEWEKVVPVDGPFQHSRSESGLIVAARRTLKALTDIAKQNPIIAEEQQLEVLTSELQRALNALVNPIQGP